MSDSKTAERNKNFRKLRKSQALKKKLTLSIPVPEGLKKAWERENRAKTFRENIRKKYLTERPEKRRIQALRIAKYEDEYMQIKKDRQFNIKNARLDGNFFKPTDPMFAIVIRIRG